VIDRASSSRDEEQRSKYEQQWARSHHGSPHRLQERYACTWSKATTAAKDAFAPQYRPTGKQFLSTRLIATIIDRSERDDRAGRRLVTCLVLAFVQEFGSAQFGDRWPSINRRSDCWE
jgi:hypothetical protein